MTPQLDLRLLGPVRLNGTGGEHAVSGAKGRAVLAALGLRLNNVVPVDQLIDDLWADSPPATARNTVQVYVSAVRRGLEAAGSALRLDRLPAGYRLAGRREQIDWHLFETLSVQARRWTRDGDQQTAADLLRRALTLWDGVPLADVTASPLRDLFVPRMESVRMSALSDRIAADLATGRGGLVGELTGLVRAYPLDERFASQLMHALHQDGQRAQALAVYRETRDRLVDELGVEPGERLRRMHAAVLADDSRLRPEPLRHPDAPGAAWSGEFVGRSAELTELGTLLAEPGLVTLTGPPGVGKSRLAAEVVTRLHGVRVVVVRLEGSSDVVSKVAEAVRATDTPIVDRLLGQAVLLVLDNCEHAAPACAELVEQLLAGADDLRVLATSTVPLRALGESVYRLAPLALPGDAVRSANDALANDAVALFCARARAVRPTFELSDEITPTVAEICRAVDGLPLALELASARTAVLSPADIATRLADQLRVLRPVGGAIGGRHGSLAAALEAAVDRLSPAERSLFARLSVFADTFPLAAAEALGGPDSLDVLHRLVDASLLVADVSGVDTQFRMLESVRQYGRSLADTEAALDLRDEYLARLASSAVAEQFGPDRLRWQRRLDAARPDLLGALDRTLRGGRFAIGLPMIADLRWWWSNSPRAGLEWYRLALREAAACAVPPELLLRVQLTAAVVASYVTLPEAMEYAKAASATATSLDDRAGMVRAAQHVSDIALELGDLETARQSGDLAWRLAARGGESFEIGRCGLSVAYNYFSDVRLDDAERWATEAAAVFARDEDEAGQADARLLVGEILLERGDLDGSEAMLGRVLGTFRRHESLEQLARAAVLLAAVVGRDGRHSDAADLVREAFDLHGTIAHPWAVAHDLEVVAAAAVGGAHGGADPRRAATLLGAAAAVRADAGLVALPRDRRVRAEVEAQCRGALGDRAYRAAARVGAALDLPGAINVARAAD
ncbi:BTAD domain-containing putative transcriptional regulator [Cryptosporangium sp. NPDC048952]|uniref:BTAD domain-containing putative transcriptional regulator n=1 Tax=Cryptosporangium sp. NPDC048952 TaxID=3363961 RepID=UPI0037101795